MDLKDQPNRHSQKPLRFHSWSRQTIKSGVLKIRAANSKIIFSFSSFFLRMFLISLAFVNSLLSKEPIQQPENNSSLTFISLGFKLMLLLWPPFWLFCRWISSLFHESILSTYGRRPVIIGQSAFR